MRKDINAGRIYVTFFT